MCGEVALISCTSGVQFCPSILDMIRNGAFRQQSKKIKSQTASFFVTSAKHHAKHNSGNGLYFYKWFEHLVERVVGASVRLLPLTQRHLARQ